MHEGLTIKVAVYISTQLVLLIPQYLTILHYDVECGVVSVNDAVMITDYVGVSQLSQQVDLLNQ